MESRSAQLNRIAPRRIRIRAAVWVTDLHGPNRDAKLESAVRRWIEADPRHAAAFELATDAWQRSGNLPAHLGRLPGSRAAKAKIPRPVLAGMAALILATAGTIFWARAGMLATGADEQRTVELSDGTEVSLNANTRVIVQYDDRVRKVALLSGEVLFNVVKHQSRPFVVVIGDRKVIAVGTSFEVRRDDPNTPAFAVTLVEGRVAIEPIAGPDLLPTDLVPGLYLLRPGERLRFDGDAAEKIDSPSIEKVTAWQRGELIFDDASLGEAAAEFNRYRPNAIAIDSTAAAKLRVGGVFRIGDPSSFAHAMATAYHLKVTERGKRIILTDEGADPKK
jgi:transmembrane sensor